jgi:hypothetical protein
MSVCVYSVYVLFCVQAAALRRADSPPKEFYRLRKKMKKLKTRRRSNKRAIVIDRQIDGLDR